jgi:acetyl-CoA carboxylase / biotin carboxylase 1
VWYPDSAYKTAQAIQDFNRGENLPLIIFANWRGFSGTAFSADCTATLYLLLFSHHCYHLYSLLFNSFPSGGTRDMYGEVLKFGAMIVDSLRTYKHPVFVYIPPGESLCIIIFRGCLTHCPYPTSDSDNTALNTAVGGELRGGAWVVIDPTINPQKMEVSHKLHW